MEETFEPGTTSAYIMHPFRAGEQGMKCCACNRVMTMGEWEDRRRCFCQSTTAVLAIARSAPPTRLETNRRTGVNTSNGISSTPPRNSRISAASSPFTTSNTPSSSRNTTSFNSNLTNYRGSVQTGNNSASSAWGCAAILCILSGLGWCITQLGSFSNNNFIQTPQPQLTPKEVITKYYQFATSNPVSSRVLVSDTLKSYWKEKSQGNATKSFFSQFQKVDVYSFQTLTQSSNNLKIRVWLKYVTKNNKASCESQVMELILDQSKGQWLIDKVSDVKYANCSK